MKKVTLSPVTRISGLLSIDVFTDNAGVINEANCIGEQFRGFELMMKGRKITDAVYFTERICGICSTAHGYMSARLVAQIYGITLTPEAILLQQAMLGAEFLQNHIRHFYLLALPDYLGNMPGNNVHPGESRFTEQQRRLLTEHYFTAMEYSKKCHEMLAVFGGKIPHQHGLVAEGVAVTPTADRKIQFLSLLKQVQGFIQNIMLEDAYLLADTYYDYYYIGVRPAQFISFGLFDPGLGNHFPTAIFNEGKITPVRPEEIAESITYSWYENVTDGFVPAPEKPTGYTWVKAPRYQGISLEGGPLARKIIAAGLGVLKPGDNPIFTGTMARLVARAEEASLIAGWIEPWIRQLPEHGQYITQTLAVENSTPVRKEALETGDAPRGPLLHGMRTINDEVDSYKVITPSTWNFSPKDDNGVRGPVEESLVGNKLQDAEHPVEVGRIVRAFDPCLSCAAHLINLEGTHPIHVNIY